MVEEDIASMPTERDMGAFAVDLVVKFMCAWQEVA